MNDQPPVQFVGGPADGHTQLVAEDVVLRAPASPEGLYVYNGTAYVWVDTREWRKAWEKHQIERPNWRFLRRLLFIFWAPALGFGLYAIFGWAMPPWIIGLFVPVALYGMWTVVKP